MKKITAWLSVLVMLLVMLPASAMTATAATSGDWEYKVLDDGTAEITDYNGNATALTIPSKIGRYTVTSIGMGIVQYNTTVTSIVIPNTVHTIGTGSLKYCTNLTSVTIPNSVTTIGGTAFGGCKKLASVTIPGSVKTIGANAFSDCEGIKTLTLQNGITEIGKNAFYRCKSLTAVTVPDSVTKIGIDAFRTCEKLKSVQLGKKVSSLGNGVFSECDALESITIPNSVTEIPENAFYHCDNLKTINLGNGLTSIGDGAFLKCVKLESVNIPSKVTSVGTQAFAGCTALSYVILGENVTDIRSKAFNGCQNLASITIPKKMEMILADAFKDCVNLNDVYYYGSEAQWDAIDIRSGNGTLTSANIRYNWYPDVKAGSWYDEAVEYVSDEGYMSGYKNGNFGPANDLQRQDFVVTLARIANANLNKYLNKNGNMIDVSKNAYFASAVAWAVDNGIITGYKNGKFGVSDKITREQVCTILYRFKGQPRVTNADATLAQFPDKNKISPYAKDAMVWAVQNGIISSTSKGTISPATGASRAQIATIIMRMCEKGLL